MSLDRNICIDGVWYGPAHGTTELPEHAAARLEELRTAPAPEVKDPSAWLDPDERFVIVEGTSLTRRSIALAMLDGAPAVPEPGPLVDDDVIVLAEGREYLRADLIEMADAYESTPPPQPVDQEPVSAPQEPVAAPDAPAALQVPVGKVEEVLAWVHGAGEGESPTDGWQDRAAAALAREHAEGTPRKTLVEPLEVALANVTDPEV